MATEYTRIVKTTVRFNTVVLETNDKVSINTLMEKGTTVGKIERIMERNIYQVTYTNIKEAEVGATLFKSTKSPKKLEVVSDNRHSIVFLDAARDVNFVVVIIKKQYILSDLIKYCEKKGTILKFHLMNQNKKYPDRDGYKIILDNDDQTKKLYQSVKENINDNIYGSHEKYQINDKRFEEINDESNNDTDDTKELQVYKQMNKASETLQISKVNVRYTYVTIACQELLNIKRKY